MPHSVFTGRPTPAPGEPLFTEEDTAAAIALAEEERDTCPSCGYPKAWCRDPAYSRGAGLEVEETTCWATYRLALRQEKHESEGTHSSTRRAMQMAIRFREGCEPEIEAGLELLHREDVADDDG